MKLATAVREDGKGNLESFHDMMRRPPSSKMSVSTVGWSDL